MLVFDLKVVFSLFISMYTAETTNGHDEIYWDIVNPPLAYGSSAILECNVPCGLNGTKDIAFWAKENGHKESLSSNLYSKDSSKYRIWTDGHICRLEIMNFTQDDANINYTCFYNFRRFSKELLLNANNFERQPTEKDIATATLTLKDVFIYTLNLINVFPRPECYAVHNMKKLSTERTTEQKDVTFNTTFKLVLNTEEIEESVVVYCQIGLKTLRVDKLYFDKKVKGNDCMLYIIFVSLLSILATALICMVLMMFTRDWNKRRQDASKKYLDDNLDNTKPLISLEEDKQKQMAEDAEEAQEQITELSNDRSHLVNISTRTSENRPKFQRCISCP